MALEKAELDGTEQSKEEARALAESLLAQKTKVENDIERINNLRTQIESSKDKLNETKNSFANGGHSLGGVGLGNTETESCITALDSAIQTLDKVKEVNEKNLVSLQNQYNAVCRRL